MSEFFLLFVVEQKKSYEKSYHYFRGYHRDDDFR